MVELWAENLVVKTVATLELNVVELKVVPKVHRKVGSKVELMEYLMVSELE